MFERTNKHFHLEFKINSETRPFPLYPSTLIIVNETLFIPPVKPLMYSLFLHAEEANFYFTNTSIILLFYDS